MNDVLGIFVVNKCHNKLVSLKGPMTYQIGVLIGYLLCIEVQVKWL